MSKFIHINGHIIEESKAVFHVNNRAFRYGDGVFESIRLINGKAQFLKDHLDRLYKGMRLLNLQIPEQLHIYHIEESIKALSKQNNLNEGARIRLTVFRNGGGLYTPNENTVSWVFEMSEMSSVYALNAHGFDIDIYGEHLKSINEFARLKSANALFYVMAANYKKEKKLGEVILLNEFKNLIEGSSSNLFFIREGNLITPSLDQGCLPGVMRKNVLDVARGMGIKVIETAVSPDALSHASEVFFTNAIQGIQWAMSYGSKRYFSSTSRKIVSALNELALRTH